jgi:hypothetical protein
MTATTSTGATCSGTSAPFDVVVGQTAKIPVTITCGTVVPDGGIGTVVVTGTLVPGDNCPALVSWSISPQQTAANGGTIDVSASASDADVSDTLTYAWAATAGTFTSGSTASTQYTCGAAGTQTLSLTISDNHTPTPCTINVMFPPIDCM